jgi:hypothetical protein
MRCGITATPGRPLIVQVCQFLPERQQVPAPGGNFPARLLPESLPQQPPSSPRWDGSSFAGKIGVRGFGHCPEPLRVAAWGCVGFICGLTCYASECPGYRRWRRALGWRSSLLLRWWLKCHFSHPIHISKSAIAALTLPLAPSAIWRVMVMGAPHRRARKAARTSFSGGWRRAGWKRV